MKQNHRVKYRYIVLSALFSFEETITLVASRSPPCWFRLGYRLKTTRKELKIIEIIKTLLRFPDK